MQIRMLNNFPVEEIVGEDVVWQGEDLKWYFTLRGSSTDYGPFASKQAAIKALKDLDY